MHLEWQPSAIADREAIFDYIAADNPPAALRVSSQIRSQVAQLSDSPWIGRLGRVQGTRELVIQRYPYIAVYAFDEHTIRILRVLHGAQEWP